MSEELEVITKEEADKLFIADLKTDLNCAFTCQLGSAVGLGLSYSTAPKEVKVVAGILFVGGIGGGAVELIRAYKHVRAYLNNPADYVRNNYSKRLI